MAFLVIMFGIFFPLSSCNSNFFNKTQTDLISNLIMKTFNNNFVILSCNPSAKNIQSYINGNHTLMVLQNGTQVQERLKMDSTNVLWNFYDCPLSFNQMVLQLIQISQVTKLWIVIHTSEDTIFSVDLNLNIIHLNLGSESIVEWIKHKETINKKQIIGTLKDGISHRIKIDDLMGTKLRVLTEYSSQYVSFNVTDVLSREPVLTASGDEILPMDYFKEAEGSFVDILGLLMKKFNFTVEVYLRKARGKIITPIAFERIGTGFSIT